MLSIMKRVKEIRNLVILIIIALVIIFFFPKQYVRGGLSGLVGPGSSAYKEEYSCLGIKHSYQQNCADCGNIYLCYGITYGKKCYIETYPGGKISKEATSCR